MEAALKAEEAKQEVKEAKSARRLQPNKLILAEQARTHWFAIVDHQTTLNEIMEPEFWTFHSAKMHPRDRVELHWEDMSRFVEVLVLDCARSWAKVYILRDEQVQKGLLNAEVDVAVARTLASHEVRHRGPRLWSVIRKTDGAILAEDMKLRDDAEDWLKKFAYRSRGPGVEQA